jgi:hypothetical protein
MVLHIEDTVGSQIQVLEDGTTIADILHALNWMKQEKERKRKYKKVYKPTGKPRGRPKKNTPASDKIKLN